MKSSEPIYYIYCYTYNYHLYSFMLYSIQILLIFIILTNFCYIYSLEIFPISRQCISIQIIVMGTPVQVEVLFDWTRLSAENRIEITPGPAQVP